MYRAADTSSNWILHRHICGGDAAIATARSWKSFLDWGYSSHPSPAQLATTLALIMCEILAPLLDASASIWHYYYYYYYYMYKLASNVLRKSAFPSS
jgi:hypothetical protein